jgi:plastocyanin
MRRLALLVGVAAALAAAGCGGGGGGSTSSTPSTASASASSSASGGQVEIKMQGFQFAPKSTTVKVGQKVEWVNQDNTDHNVTAGSGADFKSKDFGQGSSFEFTPTKAGTIKYECTLHPGMTATLNVSG